MSRFNAATIESKNDKFVISMPFAKVNKEKRTVSGFATLDNVDRHGDIVTKEASEQAFASFRNNLREMHGPSAVGKVLSFKPDTFFDKETGKTYNGIWVDTYISKGAQDAWEKCLDGTYTGFSIGGNIIDAKMEKSDDGSQTHRVIHKYDLHELSIVDSPANQLSNIFSIQKDSVGNYFIKGMISDITTENVFWCKEDEVASTSTATEKSCVVCGDEMTNIGWVEQSDTEKFESIEKVIDAYFTKDDAPGPTHAATTHEQDPQNMDNVIDSNVGINLYPDQNNKNKVSFNDGIKKSDDNNSLSKGGNEMAEDTNAEVVETTEAESPAEEVAVVDETPEVAGEEIEKAAAISEVEDVLDFEKMVSDLKTFFGESITKNYALQSATIGDLQKVINATNEELAKMTASNEDLKKAHTELSEKYETLSKSVADMYGKIEYVDHQLKGFESATAVKKSSNLEGSTGATMKKSLWQGAFLSANTLA